MTTQDLRDLVGWAGAAGSRFFRTGDYQDGFLEEPRTQPGPPPPRFSLKAEGSVQSAAYEAGGPPWLTPGVWMDVLAGIPDPGPLDVQLAPDPDRHPFLRFGHLRLTALKAPHQWGVLLRRPGTTAVASPGLNVDSGALPELVHRLLKAWEEGDEGPWRGSSPGPTPTDSSGTVVREGFHDPTPGAFSFGFWTASGRFAVDQLRELAWLAWDSGAPRIWLTPDRILLFPGIPVGHKKEWESWLAKHRLPARHGDLDHALRAAGSGPGAFHARLEVLDHLRTADSMPPQGSVLVADEGLNRGDGVCAGNGTVLIRTVGSWLYRTGEHRSGEGTLDEVLDALENPSPGPPIPPVPAVAETVVHRCRSCLTVYDPRWGDPRGDMAPGTPFSARPEGWVCPVCGGPDSGFAPVLSSAGPPLVDLIT